METHPFRIPKLLVNEDSPVASRIPQGLAEPASHPGRVTAGEGTIDATLSQQDLADVSRKRC